MILIENDEAPTGAFLFEEFDLLFVCLLRNVIL